MKSQTTKLSIVELTFDNGKSSIETMTSQQLSGLRKSARRKTILSKRILASIEVKIKIKNQPL